MRQDEGQPTSILVEPDNYGDYLKMLKGGINFHKIYNNFFKGSKLFHSQIDEMKHANLDRMKELDEEALFSIERVWRGPTYYMITRDPDRPSKILERKVIYYKPEPTKEIPNPEFYELEPLENLDPVSHVNDKGPFIELEVAVPIRFGWYGLPLQTIQQYFHDPITKISKYQNLSQIRDAKLNIKSRYISKVHFFKLIHIQRHEWEKFNSILSPKVHEITIDVKYGSKNKTSNQASVFG